MMHIRLLSVPLRATCFCLETNRTEGEIQEAHGMRMAIITSLRHSKRVSQKL